VHCILLEDSRLIIHAITLKVTKLHDHSTSMLHRWKNNFSVATQHSALCAVQKNLSLSGKDTKKHVVSLFLTHSIEVVVVEAVHFCTC